MLAYRPASTTEPSCSSPAPHKVHTAQSTHPSLFSNTQQQGPHVPSPPNKWPTCCTKAPLCMYVSGMVMQGPGNGVVAVPRRPVSAAHSAKGGPTPNPQQQARVAELRKHIEGLEQKADQKRLALIRRCQRQFEHRWNLDDKGAFKVQHNTPPSLPHLHMAISDGS